MITPSFWKIRISALTIAFVVLCFVLGLLRFLLNL